MMDYFYEVSQWKNIFYASVAVTFVCLPLWITMREDVEKWPILIKINYTAAALKATGGVALFFLAPYSACPPACRCPDLTPRAIMYSTICLALACLWIHRARVLEEERMELLCLTSVPVAARPVQGRPIEGRPMV
jgi:hypothetical protein